MKLLCAVWDCSVSVFFFRWCLMPFVVISVRGERTNTFHIQRKQTTFLHAHFIQICIEILFKVNIFLKFHWTIIFHSKSSEERNCSAQKMYIFWRNYKLLYFNNFNLEESIEFFFEIFVHIVRVLKFNLF